VSRGAVRLRGYAVTGPSPPAWDQLARVRREFDESFARAPSVVPEAHDPFLKIVVHARPYAVRLVEIRGLLADRTVVPLPGPTPELLGLTAVRGAVVPVYDLGALLGHPPVAGVPRFLLLAGDAEPVGLGFDRFDGYALVARSRLSAPRAESARSHCGEVADFGDEARPVVSIPSIQGTITERVAAMRPTRER
jgi:chemotaxis signal transduction protein